eukprot:5753922-Prymnesium_polylepis.1
MRTPGTTVGARRQSHESIFACARTAQSHGLLERSAFAAIEHEWSAKPTTERRPNRFERQPDAVLCFVRCSSRFETPVRRRTVLRQMLIVCFEMIRR